MPPRKEHGTARQSPGIEVYRCIGCGGKVAVRSVGDLGPCRTCGSSIWESARLAR